MIFSHWATTVHPLVLAQLVLSTVKSAMEYNALPAKPTIIFKTEHVFQVVSKPAQKNSFALSNL